MSNEEDSNILPEQYCPVCRKKTLTLMESAREVPYFGVLYIFSMECSTCKYHKADLEPAEAKPPTRHTVEVSSEEDLKIRVVKSSSATVKIPHMITIEAGPASNGYITNVEGILNRIKNQVEKTKEDEEDKAKKDKAKKMLKKLNKVMWGHDKLKLIIEDQNGNSAIISDKTVVKKV